jgi:hypothetical protein
MEISLSSIPNSMSEGHRFIRPDWTVLTEWVTANVPEDRFDETWTTLARDWLEHLRKSLPNHYNATESEEFLLLTKDDARLSSRLLGACEHARRTILRTLDTVARDEGYGKHVVIAFSDVESYYDYISDFYPDEGEFALSGGMFLDVGYGHFVICLAYGDQYDRIIAHELNHNLLRHLPLPLWLNEGVTQVIEDIVVDSSYFFVDQDIVRRHRAYWNADTIQSFWSGGSFFLPDEGTELSYHLAQVLFRNLMSDYPKQITSFLNTASCEDAGNSALKQLCRVSLGDRVKQFLGNGAWEPGDNCSNNN